MADAVSSSLDRNRTNRSDCGTSADSSSSVRAWRTAFLTLRDETLASSPPHHPSPPPSLVSGLISRHFLSISDALVSAAPHIPPRELTKLMFQGTSDVMLLVELASTILDDDGPENFIHIIHLRQWAPGLGGLAARYPPTTQHSKRNSGKKETDYGRGCFGQEMRRERKEFILRSIRETPPVRKQMGDMRILDIGLMNTILLGNREVKVAAVYHMEIDNAVCCPTSKRAMTDEE
ncbi:hypothetical protein QJS04_geneDACA013200 [Acorus gramineus]|uniref:Uncharacterized protein n=1 Tax=Acorus gramineus TaxID=55184 RepID=A0AAV9B9T6_ACOGR|nr:hypothetical protein QJS04_geneDACA013200 [Acorus gramineus]